MKVKYDRKGVMISAFGSKFIEAIDIRFRARNSCDANDTANER